MQDLLELLCIVETRKGHHSKSLRLSSNPEHSELASLPVLVTYALIKYFGQSLLEPTLIVETHRVYHSKSLRLSSNPGQCNLAFLLF